MHFWSVTLCCAWLKQAFFKCLAYPTPGGGGKSGLVVLRGRAIFSVPNLEKFPPHNFPCVGHSVSGSVPVELTPPPWGYNFLLWVPAKSGCLPFSFFAPPFPLVTNKSLGLKRKAEGADPPCTTYNQ